MRIFTLFLVLSFATLSAAEESAEWLSKDWFSKDRPTVIVKAYYDDQAMLQKLADRGAVWTVDAKKTHAVLQINELDQIDLIDQGYRLELDENRTQELYRSRSQLPNQRAGIDGFPCYRTVDETFATAAQIAADHPNLAQWIDIGDSWEKENGLGGSDLYILKLTNTAISGDKPKLFSMSAIHAREYTTAELNTRFAEYLINNYETNADARWLLDHHEIHLSLQSNPDGRLKAQGGQLWRKNTNQNYCGATSNSRGADLNRNFDFGWGCCGGSSANQCSDTYRGSGPASEPEVVAIQDYLSAHFEDNRGPDINDAVPSDASGVFLDIHSFSELVLYPWGNTFDAAPNEVALRTLARKFAFFNDYEPQQATELYITDGTTEDFAYGELGLAAYTFELGTTFFQSCGVFESTIFPDNLEALIYSAKTARAPYQLPAGPDVVNIAFDNNSAIVGTVLNLTASADDARFSNNNGTEPVQNIASVNAYIDVPPWEAGATPIVLSAQDGSFDTPLENIAGAIDTTGLSNGEHIVYIQAQDAAGNVGVVSAEFFYVIDPATSPVISGTVTEAGTGAGIIATISAGPFQTQSDASGLYELFVNPGNYTVTAEPLTSDFGSASTNSVAAVVGQVTTVNFSLFPYCAVLEDDAENAAVGWTATGNWARTQETAFSPTHSWTDSPGGEYSNNQDTSITSPMIDLSGVSSANLSFAQICETEATYDFCHVEVSSDNGASWSEVERYDESSGTSWAEQTLDISQIAGSATARVRFRMSTDVTVRRDGWHVDDIKVNVAGPQCVTNIDTDIDGIVDSLDNCTLVPNADQLDTDGDNYGNVCDGDFNNDGVTNFLDLIALSINFLQAGDLVTDLNGDGITNFVDFALWSEMFLQPPGPSGLVSP